MRTNSVTGSRIGDAALNATAWIFGAFLASPALVILASPFIG